MWTCQVSQATGATDGCWGQEAIEAVLYLGPRRRDRGGTRSGEGRGSGAESSTPERRRLVLRGLGGPGVDRDAPRPEPHPAPRPEARTGVPARVLGAGRGR